jgi:hypothetical protein
MLSSPPDSFMLPEVVTVPKNLKIISGDEYNLPTQNDSQNVWKVQRKNLHLLTLLRVGYSASTRPNVSNPTCYLQPPVYLLWVQAGQKERKCWTQR